MSRYKAKLSIKKIKFDKRILIGISVILAAFLVTFLLTKEITPSVKHHSIELKDYTVH